MLFRVVKCFKCNFYQVDSVKKAKKWQCKMCGENQTLQREFATGSAKDCRLQVQSLNMQKTETDDQKHEYAMKVLTGEIQVPKIEEGVPEGASVTVGSGVWSALTDSVDEGEEEGSIFQKASTVKTVLNSPALNTPSWRDFYGQKRESAREKREFEENSRQFFSPQSYSYEKKSTPLPKLLDYAQMKRSRKGMDWKSPKPPTYDFQPLKKKFKEDEDSSKDNAQEMPSSSSKWSSFFEEEN